MKLRILQIPERSILKIKIKISGQTESPKRYLLQHESQGPNRFCRLDQSPRSRAQFLEQSTQQPNAQTVQQQKEQSQRGGKFKNKINSVGNNNTLIHCSFNNYFQKISSKVILK